jgi:hypothetical protein
MADLSWTFKALDRFSGPTKQMGQSAKQLKTELNAVDKAMDKMSKVGAGMRGMKGFDDVLASASKPAAISKTATIIGNIFGASAAAKYSGVASKLAAADARLGDFGLSFAGIGKVGGGVMLGLATAVGAVVVALGAAAVGAGALTVKLGAAFTKAAVSSLSFKENTMIAFETMLGTKEAAGDLYKQAVKFAAATPFATNQVVGAYQKLIVGGFKTAELENIMKAVGDVAAMKGFDPAVMDEMITGLSKLRGVGKLTGEMFQLQAFEPLQGAILEQLQKSMGAKDTDAVRKAISAGKVDAKTAESAILEVIRTKYSGGTLGKGMEKFSTSYTGLMSTLGSRMDEIFQSAGESKGGGLSKYFEGIKAFTGWAANAFDPASESGKRVVAIVDRIGGVFAKLFATDGKTLDGTLNGVLTTIEKIMPYVEVFAEGLKEGLGEVLGPLMKAFGEMDKTDGKGMDTLAKTFKALGLAAGEVVGFLMIVAVAMGAITGATLLVSSVLAGTGRRLLTWSVEVLSAVGGLASSIYAKGASVGTSIISGIMAGLGGAKSMVIGAIQGLGGEMLSAVKSTLGIASPSKEFAKLGGFVGQGFSVGVQGSSPLVTRSIDSMVAAPSQSSVSGSGGGGRGFSIQVGDINISGSGGDPASIKLAILEAFEELAVEFGAAA